MQWSTCVIRTGSRNYVQSRICTMPSAEICPILRKPPLLLRNIIMGAGQRVLGLLPAVMHNLHLQYRRGSWISSYYMKSENMNILFLYILLIGNLLARDYESKPRIKHSYWLLFTRPTTGELAYDTRALELPTVMWAITLQWPCLKGSLFCNRANALKRILNIEKTHFHSVS